MKILFLTDNFPPEVNAPATRTYEHCKEWVKQGEEVTVITCTPNFPQGKVYTGYRNRLYQKEIMDGIRVIRIWSYITANEGFLKRTLDYISFSVTSFFAGLFQQADIIIATSPQFFTALSGRTRIHQNSRCHERKSYNPLSGMGGKKMLPLCQKNHRCNGLIQKEVKRKRNPSPKDRSYKKRGKQGIVHSHV